MSAAQQDDQDFRENDCISFREPDQVDEQPLVDYHTLMEPGTSEIVIKKSTFLGYAFPMTEEQAAIDQLEAIKREHNDARHHVYAWRLGIPGQTGSQQLQRYSDDGEPQGTAGLPVLESLSRLDLTDAMVVVVRYFGGILLGRGGLVRAYSEAASTAVAAAEPVLMTSQDIYHLVLPYAYFDTFNHRAALQGIAILNTEYGSAVSLEVGVPTEKVADFLAFTANLSGGDVIPAFYSKRYVPLTVPSPEVEP
ncbi:MAG TPA: DUF1949 domain-containing protein [Clostridiaceae bacterium]|nr:DUF1949 domain-containing protein [Clostridiaceae bacterium]